MTSIVKGLQSLSGLVLCLLLLTACSPNSVSSRAPQASDSVTNYTVRGVVKEVKPDGKTLVIAHEEVPGYMPKMTMPFEVRPKDEHSKVKAGDSVEFRMQVTARDGWINQISVLPAAPTSPTASTPPTSPTPPAAPSDGVNIVPNVAELKVGELVPNYTLTNQLGRRIQLSDFKGNALAFTFIFTRCPFPTFCLRMTENFGAVQKILTTQKAVKNWRLLTLSFDPDYDSPERLREYGERHQYDPNVWSLATGDFDSMFRLASQFGLYFGKNLPPEQQNHNLRTVVITPSGRVHQIFMGNEWTVEELAQSIAAAAKQP